MTDAAGTCLLLMSAPYVLLPSKGRWSNPWSVIRARVRHYVAVWITLDEGSNERQRNFLIIFTWYVPMTTQHVSISWIDVITSNILLLLLTELLQIYILYKKFDKICNIWNLPSHLDPALPNIWNIFEHNLYKCNDVQIHIYFPRVLYLFYLFILVFSWLFSFHLYSDDVEHIVNIFCICILFTHTFAY